MKVLITGGNGYIAKSIAKTLTIAKSISVTRKDFDLIDRESTNRYFKDKYFDVVIHTAVVGGSRLQKDNGDTFYQNIQMFYNLLNNKHCFNKLIHFGSGAELEMPTDPYGLSKNVINKIINQESNFYNIRIFGVFDKDELDTRFIKNCIKCYINNEPIKIHQNKFMDFFYMEDLIKLIKHYIYKENLPKNVDCTYGKNTSLLDIAHIVNSLSNHKVEINIGEGKGKNYTGSPILLNIKWIGLKQGIKETYNSLK